MLKVRAYNIIVYVALRQIRGANATLCGSEAGFPPIPVKNIEVAVSVFVKCKPKCCLLMLIFVT